MHPNDPTKVDQTGLILQNTIQQKRNQLRAVYGKPGKEQEAAALQQEVDGLLLELNAYQNNQPQKVLPSTTVMAGGGFMQDYGGGILQSGMSYAGTGAAIGGPWGAAIGGAVGIGMGIANAKKMQKQEEEAQLKQDNAETAMLNSLGNPSITYNYAAGGPAMTHQANLEGGEIILNGTELDKVKGPKHEDGGVTMNLKDDSFVFSDRLGPKGKKGKTYAQLAKQIKMDYKGREGDSISQESKMRQIEALKAQQEADPAIHKLREETNPEMAGGGQPHILYSAGVYAAGYPGNPKTDALLYGLGNFGNAGGTGYGQFGQDVWGNPQAGLRYQLGDSPEQLFNEYGAAEVPGEVSQVGLTPSTGGMPVMSNAPFGQQVVAPSGMSNMTTPPRDRSQDMTYGPSDKNTLTYSPMKGDPATASRSYTDALGVTEPLNPALSPINFNMGNTGAYSLPNGDMVTPEGGTPITDVTNRAANGSSVDDILGQMDKNAKLGAAFNALGPASQLVGAIGGPETTEFQRINPAYADPTAAMNAVDREAAFARSHAGRQVANASNSRGSLLANTVAANTGINRNANNTKAQTRANYDLQNTNIANQTEAANNQIAMQETIANEQNRAAYRNMLTGAATDAGMIGANMYRDRNLGLGDDLYNQRTLNTLGSMGYYYVPNADGTITFLPPNQ